MSARSQGLRNLWNPLLRTFSSFPMQLLETASKKGNSIIAGRSNNKIIRRLLHARVSLDPAFRNTVGSLRVGEGSPHPLPPSTGWLKKMSHEKNAISQQLVDIFQPKFHIFQRTYYKTVTEISLNSVIFIIIYRSLNELLYIFKCAHGKVGSRLDFDKLLRIHWKI